MPTFNPQVPQANPEEFLRYSQGTHTIPVDKSTGILLDTAGNAISGVASLADQIVKQTISSDIQKGVDQQQSQFTGQLENTAKSMGISTGNQGMDILPTGDQTQNIRAGNKINDTLYSANITSIAKQLRAQYPGYRDYIDTEISKVSGMPVANAYYKNLMQDINSGLQ